HSYFLYAPAPHAHLHSFPTRRSSDLLATLRTVPIVARMIAIVKARAVRTLEELTTHSRAAAGHDLFQDLPVPLRHGGSKALPVIRRQLSEPLMNSRTLTTLAGGGVHQRLPMNLSSRCWCWVLQRLVRWV